MLNQKLFACFKLLDRRISDDQSDSSPYGEKAVVLAIFISWQTYILWFTELIEEN